MRENCDAQTRPTTREQIVSPIETPFGLVDNNCQRAASDIKRQVVVFENQKDSLSKVLLAMHRAIEALEENISGPGGWTPFASGDLEKFKKVVSQEVLFLDRDSDHALNLFKQIMERAVNDPHFDMFAESDDVRHAWSQMQFIAERLAQHFRNRVGIGSEHPDPLQDVEFLGACRLITDFPIKGFSLLEKSPLRFNKNQSGSQMVAAARENKSLLKVALEDLKNATNRSDHKNRPFVFDRLSLMDRYLSRLD